MSKFAISPFIMEEINAHLLSLDEKPQFGSALPFPKEALETELKRLFKRPDFSFEYHLRGWKERNDLLKSYENAELLAIYFPPLPSHIHLLMNNQDLKSMMGELFGGDEGAEAFFENDHLVGFYHFLAVKVISVLSGLGVTNGLSPIVDECDKSSMGSEEYFGVDISCKLGQKNFNARLLISPAFRDEWKSHFAALSSQAMPKDIARKIPIKLALEIGKTTLEMEEWRQVKEGDFIRLDTCSFDFETKKGRVVFSLNGSPLFRGKIRNEGIKVLEYPLYKEVTEFMDEQNNDEENLYGDLNQEEDDEFADEEYSEESPIDETESTLTEDENDEKIERGLHPSLLDESSEGRISADKIPLELTIEVARIQINADELMHIIPGNLLELNVSPASGVDLVINGKKVGRGELVKIGEVVGVRILKL